MSEREQFIKLVQEHGKAEYFHRETRETFSALVAHYDALQSRHAALQTLLKVAKCPNCGQHNGEPDGFTVDVDDYGQPVAVQCQWCYERHQLTIPLSPQKGLDHE